MTITEKLLGNLIKSSILSILKEAKIDIHDITEKLNEIEFSDNWVLDAEIVEKKEILIKDLKTIASVETMFELRDLYDEELNNGQKIFFLNDEEKDEEKLHFLNEVYDKIETLIKPKNPSHFKKVMKGIYAIKNCLGDIQYFVMIQLGRNGGEHNFCNDYMKTLYEVYQILDEKSEWTSMTDTSCDVCDDLYNFVVTFVLKNE